MKLSGHYNKAIIIITVFVLSIGALFYFVVINYISKTQLDTELTEEAEELTSYINIHGRLPTQDFGEYKTVFEKATSEITLKRYFDTMYINPKAKEIQKARAVEMGIILQGNNHKATIIISKAGTAYLVQIIAFITLILLLSLLIVLFLINRYVLIRLWRPFHDLLSQVKAYSVTDNASFKLLSNDVDEFVELSNAMNVMSSGVKMDFQNLKHFSENASHEILTPLAVITSKLDTLIQDETLNRNQYDQISDIYVAADRLSRLNQSLLLLLKIENNLMEDSERLSIDALIYEKLKQFHELALSKYLTVTEDLDYKWIYSSKYLMDILLNNIFSNAIRHNYSQGKIMIVLTKDKLIFQNTGRAEALNANTVFERFRKGPNSEGSGLGLTIVKNICTLYNWNITYCYRDCLHTFEIVF